MHILFIATHHLVVDDVELIKISIKNSYVYKSFESPG